MLAILTDNTKISKTILILGILTDKFKHKCNWGKVCHTICIKTFKKKWQNLKYPRTVDKLNTLCQIHIQVVFRYSDIRHWCPRVFFNL